MTAQAIEKIFYNGLEIILSKLYRVGDNLENS